MKVHQLLSGRHRKVATIPAGSTVAEAIDKMAQLQVAALIVTDKGRPAGIFTERDVVRCYVRHGRRLFDQVPVTEAMTADMIVATADESVATAVATMVGQRIRHLPIVEHGQVVGMLSLCDLVTSHVRNLTVELQYMHDFIADLEHDNNP